MSSDSDSYTSESDDDDLESEEEEPRLKYDRVSNDLLKILSKDAASCVAMHFKFVALGTHWGSIYIMDHIGNKIKTKQFSSHNTQVTGISLDAEGEYLASCSDDGRVVVTGLYSDDDNQTINVDKPVKSVALDPNFSKSGSKQLVYGIDSLVLFEKKGWLGSKSTVLHTGEGQVRNIKWHGQLIAWANDWGVKMYDMKQRRRITHIPRSKDGKLRPELYPAHIAWKDESTLLVGWANEIKVCVVRERRSRDLSREPEKYVEIVYHFPIEFMCSGIAPFDDKIVVLAYEISEEEMNSEATSYKASNKPSDRPQLKIFEPDLAEGGYDEISSDALTIRGYQTYRCNDYSLAYENSEGMLFIVSPKDIVAAQRRDLDDHVQWLLECKRYEEALQNVATHGKQLKQHNFVDVGLIYINYLLAVEEYEDAAKACVRVLGNDIQLWDDMVTKFISAGQALALCPYLPKGDVRLPQRCYDIILQKVLEEDHKVFAKLIKEWPADLYTLSLVVSFLNAKLDRVENDNTDKTLLATLARLYALDHRFDLALRIYLKLRDKDTFELIRKHNLYAALKKNIVLLMEFGRDEAVTLMLDNVDHVPIEKVVKELEKHKEFQHMYLHSLFLRDPDLGSNYHELQLHLYAEFDRPKLLPFLKSSNHYRLENALQVCEEREYVDETVFLLGRMGNASKALSIISSHYPNVFPAINFCKEQNDLELWKELIDTSLNRPEYIRDLLLNIGTHVDPVILIRKIPTGMRIPGLRDALVKILQDYSMQTSMWFQCKNILSSDVLVLSKRRHKLRTRPFRVDENTVCDACGHQLLNFTGTDDGPLINAFYCQHLFHDACLQQNQNSCSICSGQRRRILSPR